MKIIAFCGYCKDPIHEDEEYIVDIMNGEKIYYQNECYEQMNTIYDPMGLSELCLFD